MAVGNVSRCSLFRIGGSVLALSALSAFGVTLNPIEAKALSLTVEDYAFTSVPLRCRSRPLTCARASSLGTRRRQLYALVIFRGCEEITTRSQAVRLTICMRSCMPIRGAVHTT